MTAITQEAVNATHWRHRQTAHEDIDGVAFVACKCGRMFADDADATAHWWRAAKATQRAQDAHAAKTVAA